MYAYEYLYVIHTALTCGLDLSKEGPIQRRGAFKHFHTIAANLPNFNCPLRGKNAKKLQLIATGMGGKVCESKRKAFKRNFGILIDSLHLAEQKQN